MNVSCKLQRTLSHSIVIHKNRPHVLLHLRKRSCCIYKSQYKCCYWNLMYQSNANTVSFSIFCILYIYLQKSCKIFYNKFKKKTFRFNNVCMYFSVFYFNHDYPDPVLSQVVTQERLGGNQKQLNNYPVKYIGIYIF